MPRARQSYQPVSIAVSQVTAPMWDEVDRYVKQRKAEDPDYSRTSFVNEAVARFLKHVKREKA